MLWPSLTVSSATEPTGHYPGKALFVIVYNLSYQNMNGERSKYAMSKSNTEILYVCMWKAGKQVDIIRGY